MTPDATITRPLTLRDVAEQSKSIDEFGLNLRDWQHEIQRSGVHSRKAMGLRLNTEPPLLAEKFELGDVADAYLAAYAEWLSDSARIPRPNWCRQRKRCADKPWFASPDTKSLLVKSPASFRQRNLFTVPEAVFTPRRGRPPVSAEQKRVKAVLRQREYRARIRQLVSEARQQAADRDRLSSVGATAPED